MSMQLAEVSQAVSADAHAVLLLDQAGWHIDQANRSALDHHVDRPARLGACMMGNGIWY